MKYIKLFEDFSNEPDSKLSEAATEAKAKVDAMSPEQLTQAQKELQALATRLKLVVADLADANKVQAALEKYPLNVSESVNEGLKEWWGKVKNTVGSWIKGIGIVGVIGSVVTAVIASGDISGNLQAAAPGPELVYSAIALVIASITVAVGNKLKNA